MPDPTPFERFAELQRKLNDLRDVPLTDEWALKRYVDASEELIAAARTLPVDKMLAERKRLLNALDMMAQELRYWMKEKGLSDETIAACVQSLTRLNNEPSRNT